MSSTRVLCAALIGLAAAPALAVITRHDIPIAAYEARGHLLPTYCQLGLPDGGGALIAPGWVLTAAHLAPIRAGHVIACGGEKLTVAEFITHPAFDDHVGRHDLALIRLKSPARTLPTPVSRNPVAAGTVLELVGHYQGGTGLTGGVGRLPTGLRGATNRVSQADPHWLRMVMDPPASPDTTPLEGVSGAGDSGAPAFVIKGGHPLIVGIGSRSSDTNENGIEQDYGDTDLYVPVTPYAGWIDRVIGGREGAGWRWLDGQADRPWLPPLLASGLLVICALVLVLVTRRRRSVLGVRH